MNAIELDKLGKDEKVKSTTPKKYPAMLIGRRGLIKDTEERELEQRSVNFAKVWLSR